MLNGALKQETGSSQEILLLDYAGRLAKHAKDRQAIHLHLSRLQPGNRREHHVRIAANSFETLLKRHEGQSFHFGNGDLVLLFKGAKPEEVEQAVGKVRYLFSDDPLAADDGSSSGGVSTWYDLERDYITFRAMAEQAAQAADARRKEQQNVANRAIGLPSEDAPKAPMTATMLGKLEQGVASMDLSNLIRRQPICVLLPNMPPKVVFNEVYVSIPELRRRVLPEADLVANHWLFQQFTQTLDMRVLSLLPPLEASITTATSLNINVSTLLSPQFLTFDTKLRNITQKTVVFELQPMDVFRDVGAFMFARDFVRERGYRLCLDGLNHLTYPLIQRSQMGLDMEKIVWAADLGIGGRDRHRDRFRQAVRDAGPARVILCRCDGPESVAFGQELGITLYQGRHIDRLLTGGVGTKAGGVAAA